MDRNTSKFVAVLICCFLFILFSTATAVQADIYRYIDENGVMHFTNTPTSSSQQYQVFIKERSRLTSRHSSQKYDRAIADASQQYGVSAPLIKAIIKAESDFDPMAVSKKRGHGADADYAAEFQTPGAQRSF